MYNAGDRKDIRKAEKASQLVEAARAEFVRHMMSTIEGRAYAHAQLVRAHVFSTSFNLNPLQMAFAEGERNAGLQLINDLMQYCPDQYVLMMRESNDRYHSNDRSPNGADSASGSEHSRGPHTNGRTQASSEWDPYAGTDAYEGGAED